MTNTSDSDGKKVLVVDDAQSVSQLLEDMLSRAGYRVVVSDSGESALEAYAFFNPDIILLDIVLPGIDGYEVCRRIRSAASEYLKILMVTSQKKLEERLKGYEAGADDYIVKPFEKEEVLAKVRVFERLKSAEDRLKALNEQLNEQVRIRTEQVLASQKMAELGKHAAWFVNNTYEPLGKFIAMSHILALKYPSDPHVRAQRLAAGNMKRIIAGMLNAGARKNGSDIRKLNLNQVVRDKIGILDARGMFDGNIGLETKLRKLPAVKGVYTHFDQCIGNLIDNAFDAMYENEKGLLTIESSFDNENVIIKVSDTGHGISKEKMSKIFNPFYTTKPPSADDGRPTGTGLGLPSCREMIESYGGEILVYSKVGKGTSFALKVPAQKEIE